MPSLQSIEGGRDASENLANWLKGPLVAQIKQEVTVELPNESKNAVDLLGFEYDWLCCDIHGQVALFSTAGSGFTPAAFVRDTDSHYDAIDAIIALPSSTKAKFAPKSSKGLINTWKLVAERGLFAFDGEPAGGPYQLVAAPNKPVLIGDLPSGVSRIVSRIMLAVDFGATTAVTENQLREMSL